MHEKTILNCGVWLNVSGIYEAEKQSMHRHIFCKKENNFAVKKSQSHMYRSSAASHFHGKNMILGLVMGPLAILKNKVWANYEQQFSHVVKVR